MKIDSEIMARDRAALERRIDGGALDIFNWRQRNVTPRKISDPVDQEQPGTPA